MLRSALVAWLWLGCVDAGAGAKEAPGDSIQQDVKYVWPITTWKVPLTPFPGPGNGKALEDRSLASNLADIAIKAYDKYMKDILPFELKADPQFAEEFANGDSTRMNLAFLRWQKRVYADVKKGQVPLDELSWDGKPIPKHKGIDYTWRELYSSPEFKKLRSQLNRLSGMYLSYAGRNDEGERPRFRIFIWASVFRFADSMRPLARTGAMVTGTFFAKYHSDRRGAQKFAFEDPRGINPPFGKTHNHQPREGELIMFPSWASHFITPQPKNFTNVFFQFVVWPQEGARDFDWEDDATGDYTYRKQFNIKRPKGAGDATPSKKKPKTEL